MTRIKIVISMIDGVITLVSDKFASRNKVNYMNKTKFYLNLGVSGFNHIFQFYCMNIYWKYQLFQLF